MSVCDLTDDAVRACENFSLCRQHASLSIRVAYQYFTEIDVRLQTCKWIGQNCPGGLSALLQGASDFTSEREFVKDSTVEVGDLIMECHSSINLDDSTLSDLQRRVHDYNTLFKNYVNELQAVADSDPLATLRLKIMAKKLQYDNSETIVFVENPNIDSDCLHTVVGLLENYFEQSSKHPCNKAKMDLAYRDWIMALRNPNFKQQYMLDRVLRFVRKWHTSLNNANSSFYMFLLLSLLGFGTSTKSGESAYLKEAAKMKEDMKRLSRGEPRARQPREWLGRDESGRINRLIPKSRIPMENHRVTGAARSSLAVCKGSIVGTPKKAAGFINMDLKDKDPGCAVKVFFVPVHSNTTGTFFQGTRVEFFLGFNQTNGYEAYEVRELERFGAPAVESWLR